jgi:hypothetical protein
MIRRVLPGMALLALAACVSAPSKDHSKLIAARPRSILIVPVVNAAADVTASDYFLSTVPVPVAERGYYVFPVNLVKRLLEDEGLADAGLVHSADPARLASMFGADAVLYVTIERWDARYILISTKVTVEFSYVLKDGRTGEDLWVDRRRMQYSSGDGGGGLVGALVKAAMTKASPNYMPLARQANAGALAYPGPGFPAGPYRPEHGQDWVPPAGTATAVAAPAPAPAAPRRVPGAATPASTSTPSPAALTPAAASRPEPRTPSPAAR